MNNPYSLCSGLRGPSNWWHLSSQLWTETGTGRREYIFNPYENEQGFGLD